MKKKLKLSEDSVDYAVGLVSGSLSKSGSGPGSGSLPALFKTTSAPTSALFQPAPQFVKNVESKEKPKPTPDVKVQTQKKVQKETPAEIKVQSREQSLQAADDDDVTVRPRKRKAPPAGDEEPDFWIQRRHKLKEKKTKDIERDKRTVFVGNLPLSATKKTVRLLFKDHGPIESVRFRSLVREDPSMSRKVASIMRKAHPQKQSINAYVVFKEEQSVISALHRNGLELEPDQFIRVDRIRDSHSHDHKRSIFVGNLPFDLTEALLRKHFSDCGSVEAVRLIRDPQTGLGKGFGYLLFTSADSVQLALKLNGSKLEGRSIRVKRSIQNEKLKKSQENKPGKHARRRERSQGQTRSKSRPGTTPRAQFRGEMADPNKKKKKSVKKKAKTKTKTKGKKKVTPGLNKD